MARITITVEDLAEGKVSIKSDPTFETMAKMVNAGHEISSAHGYALRMLREARALSKEIGPLKILLPGLGK